MSSASSGRYKSRLFNFVHKQSRRLTENLGSTFRHLQVATSWVAPVVLYPIYLLFQSTRSAGKQLHQAVQQSWPQLQDGSLAEEEFSRHLPPDDTDSQPQTPSPADMPIQRVLLLVDDLPLLPKREPAPLLPLSFSREPANSPSRNRPVVRGIATQLSSRTLVLVTAQNEILDILTPQQQQKLQERIIGEVANYWHLQRLAHLPGQRFTTQLHLPTEQDSPNPVVRLFSSLMAWVQTGAIALVANIFQESSLVRSQESVVSSEKGELILLPYRALVFLDRTVADLESNHLAPVSKVAIALGKSSWEIVHLVQTQLTVSKSGLAQPADRKSPAIAPDGSETHTFRIQALIWAAIDYFFGHRSGKQLGQTTPITDYLELPAGSKPRRKPLPHRRSTRQSGGGIIRPPSASSKLPDTQLPSRPELVSQDVDPWLTSSDLFGDPESEGEPSTSHVPHSSTSQTMSQVAGKTNPALPSRQSTGYSLSNLINRFQALLQKPKQASALVERKKHNRSVTQTRKSAKTAALARVGGFSPIATPPPGAHASKTTPSPVSQHGSLAKEEFSRQLPPRRVSAGEISNQPRSQSTQLDPAPDWIETRATGMGYVKHPLEKLLEWLDRAMLWLEDVLMRVFEWVQQLWRGK